jgi:hypothetical protein
LYSTDTSAELLSYDLEVEIDEPQIVSNILLTLKHVILFLSNGRVEWLIKYYPDLMEEDSNIKPFQLDKFYEYYKPISHSCYDH